MINNVHNFTKKLGAMLRYFHKPADEEIKDVWFMICNQALTDEEFDKAFELVIRRSSFLPPIDDFIKLVKGDRALWEEMEAEIIWEHLIDLSQIATSTWKPDVERRRGYLETLKPAYAHGLSRIGGLVSLGNVPVESTHWKKKDFMMYVSKYKQMEQFEAEQEQQAAIAPSTLPALSHGVGGFIELRSMETGAAVTVDRRGGSNGLGSISMADVDVGF